MNKRELGTEYEKRAENYLEERGMKILFRNYRCKQGEIDIIGFHEGFYVFVEVKYRKNTEAGFPEEAVNYRKQKTICQVADYYRYSHNIGDITPVRYDVVAICGGEIIWYRNAFDHIWK